MSTPSVYASSSSESSKPIVEVTEGQVVPTPGPSVSAALLDAISAPPRAACLPSRNRTATGRRSTEDTIRLLRRETRVQQKEHSKQMANLLDLLTQTFPASKAACARPTVEAEPQPAGPERTPLLGTQQQASISQEFSPVLPPTKENVVTRVASMILEGLRALRTPDIPHPSAEDGNMILATLSAEQPTAKQSTAKDFFQDLFSEVPLECPTRMAQNTQLSSTCTTTEILTTLGAEIIATLMLDKVKKLPHLAADASLKDLAGFASAVSNLAASFCLLESETGCYLTNPAMLSDITAKMPCSLRMTWLMEVRQQQAPATVMHLAEFLEGVARAIPLSGMVDSVQPVSEVLAGSAKAKQNTPFEVKRYR